MEKQDIIAVLQKMLSHYKSVLDCQTYETLSARCRNSKIQLGFCYWLSDIDSFDDKHLILLELRKDSGLIRENVKHYWYQTVTDNIEAVEDDLNDDYFSANDVLNLAIKPRIANIERTITRLQTELQTSNN